MENPSQSREIENFRFPMFNYKTKLIKERSNDIITKNEIERLGIRFFFKNIKNR